jgi:hypothetical protein
MPIDPAVLQRRHWQDGRIRIGVKTTRGGKTFPSKIETFRFTSASETMIEGVAKLYGGNVQPWQAPDGPQFEVITRATRIPVILPPNPLSQNMEAWNGRLCVRRCTGKMMQPPFIGPCQCGPDLDIGARLCKPTTRLAIFLKKVPSLGLWRLDSTGENAAAELPNAAELLALAGQYVDAWLFLDKRNGSILDEETGRLTPTTFVVPGLTIEGTSVEELMSGETARRAQLGRRAEKAIEGPGTPDYLAQARAATAADEVSAIFHAAKAAGDLTSELRDELNAIGVELRQREAAPGIAASPSSPSSPGTTVSGAPSDQLCAQIMTTWPGTLTELHAAFATATGTTLKHATPGQLAGFLTAHCRPETGRDGEVVEAEVVEDQERDAPFPQHAEIITTQASDRGGRPNDRLKNEPANQDQ